jgi:hypothetical protein
MDESISATLLFQTLGTDSAENTVLLFHWNCCLRPALCVVLLLAPSVQIAQKTQLLVVVYGPLPSINCRCITVSFGVVLLILVILVTIHSSRLLSKNINI